jgi:hypothetical protein
MLLARGKKKSGFVFSVPHVDRGTLNSTNKITLGVIKTRFGPLAWSSSSSTTVKLPAHQNS